MEQIQKKYQVIKCPHCGYEYIPSEIFYPGDLTGGRTESLVRDALGKILYLEYGESKYTEGRKLDPCQPEQYYCDSCDKPFIVEPVITYRVKKEVEELDFSNESVSLL